MSKQQNSAHYNKDTIQQVVMWILSITCRSLANTHLLIKWSFRLADVIEKLASVEEAGLWIHMRKNITATTCIQSFWGETKTHSNCNITKTKLNQQQRKRKYENCITNCLNIFQKQKCISVALIRHAVFIATYPHILYQHFHSLLTTHYSSWCHTDPFIPKCTSLHAPQILHLADVVQVYKLHSLIYLLI